MKFIAFEGLDGSGKTVQSKLLCERLCNLGFRAMCVSFPQYAFPSSYGISMFLRKEIQGFTPYQLVQLFAYDRLLWYKRFVVYIHTVPLDYMILNRYVESNMIYQGARELDKNKLIHWVETLEYELNMLPVPNKTFYLDVPVDVSQEWMKRERKSLDVNESNVKYLNECREMAKYLLKRSNHWSWVSCAKDSDSVRSIEDIHAEILKSTLTV